MTSTATSGGRGVKRSLGGEDADELEKRRLEVGEEAMAGWLGALVVFFSVFCFLFFFFVICYLFYHLVDIWRSQTRRKTRWRVG